MFDLISVIVPIYNVENYLENCIYSIINQTYTNIEIILIDDGSTDRCKYICDEFLDKDDRIRVIHKSNGGLSEARNVGIEMSNGNYITFIDSDDYISIDYIESLYRSIRRNIADIAILKLKFTTSLNESLEANRIMHEKVFNKEEALSEILYSNEFSTSACGKLFAKNLFSYIRFPVGKYSEDLFTIYKTFLDSKKIVFIDNEAYHYFMRQGSITNKKFNIKHLDTIEALHLINKNVVSIYPRLKTAYKSAYIEAIARLLQVNIPIQYLVTNSLWNDVKKFRKDVLFDKLAPKRVKGYSLLLYMGPNFTKLFIRFYYYLKRKVK